MIFFGMNHLQRKITWLSKALEFLQLISVELPNRRTSSGKGKLKKVLNVYKENISAAYYISDIEIEEPSPIYDWDTKNKAEELDRLHAAMNEKLATASYTENLQILILVPDSW